MINNVTGVRNSIWFRRALYAVDNLHALIVIQAVPKSSMVALHQLKQRASETLTTSGDNHAMLPTRLAVSRLPARSIYPEFTAQPIKARGFGPKGVLVRY
jgi:hypothetical protein